jgi:hypothetical protein
MNRTTKLILVAVALASLLGPSNVVAQRNDPKNG